MSETTATVLKQSLASLSLGSGNKSSNKTFMSSAGSEESTPCKSIMSSRDADENLTASPLSASSKNRFRTNLSAIKNLPPIRTSPLQEVSPNNMLNKSPSLLRTRNPPAPMDMTPQKSWDPSFASHQKTVSEINDHHLPWSSDIRQRKVSVGQNAGCDGVGVVAPPVAASPRTPHISQINVKRQKQKSQLSRSVCLNPAAPATRDSGSNSAITQAKPSQGFAVPALPVRKAAVQSADSQKSQIDSWKQKYLDEVKARTTVEAKYHHEQQIRVRLEMDYKLLQRKCQDLERKLLQVEQDQNNSFQTASSDYEDDFGDNQ